MLFYHKKNRKKIIATPPPPSDLNTLVLHGASLFFVASLAPVLDVSNVMPIESTRSPPRGQGEACQATAWPKAFFFAKGAPPPPKTKVTIVGQNEISSWGNVVGPFLVHKILGPNPLPKTPPFSTALGSPLRDKSRGGC